MKEFFTSGVHGQTWEPNNLQCAVEALRLALKGRDEMSTNCRQKALSHSWTCSGKQIETIYADLIGQKEEKSKNAAGSVAVVARLVFYLTQWFFLMLLIVLFLLPFLKVYKPQEAKTNEKSCRVDGGEASKKRRTSTSRGSEHWRFFYIFLKNQKECWESSCSRLMLVCTCLFLSLAVFYSADF
jgi:hypothetical protein